MVVLDASVLVELVIDGEHRNGADRLLDRYVADSHTMLVTAAHGLIEATSALRRLTRSGAITVDDGARATQWLADLSMVLDPTGPRLAHIWALRDRMSAYDAAYAAAAAALDVRLLSTDARLLEACSAAGIAAVHLDELPPAG